ncbi:MAG: hypothetical protein IPJ40_12215 [Saprospirales bacterium]|nr:hypothetical protein [Saprospirales bacterium]
MDLPVILSITGKSSLILLKSSYAMMKTIFTGFLLLLFFSGMTAQRNCEGYLPFEEGVSFEQTYYDARGNVTSVSISSMNGIESTAGGYKAIFQHKLVDEKGKEVSTGSYEITCRDVVFEMNVNNLLNPSMLEAYQSMELTVSGDGIQFPANLSVGQQLAEGNTVVDVTSDGLAIVKLTFAVKDRKVEAKETITTPAGTFECYKIRSTINYQTMFLTRTYTTVGWYARKVGLVKQETYDGKGGLNSWMEMTKWGR